MRIFICIYILFAICDVDCGRNNKKVQIKIHVPKILKHHHHTKLVFIHKHDKQRPTPKSHKPPKEAYKNINHFYNIKPPMEFIKQPVIIKKEKTIHHHHIHHYHHGNEKHKPAKTIKPEKHVFHTKQRYHAYQHQYGSKSERYNPVHKFKSDNRFDNDKNKEKLLGFDSADSYDNFSNGYRVKEDYEDEDEDEEYN